MASQAIMRSSTWSATMARRMDRTKQLNSRALRAVTPSLENRAYMATQAKVSAVIRSTRAPNGSRRMAYSPQTEGASETSEAVPSRRTCTDHMAAATADAAEHR